MELTMLPHLYQPSVDVNDSLCFVSNKAVVYLFKKSGLTIDEILSQAEKEFNLSDTVQLLQLLGMDTDEFFEKCEKRWPDYRENFVRLLMVSRLIGHGQGASEARICELENEMDERCSNELDFDNEMNSLRRDFQNDIDRLRDEIARLWQALHDRDDR
jgi:hypothetical protein